MNECKKRHFDSVERNLRIARDCIHAHRTTTAFVALTKTVRHISAIILDLWEISENEKEIKAAKSCAN